MEEISTRRWFKILFLSTLPFFNVAYFFILKKDEKMKNYAVAALSLLAWATFVLFLLLAVLGYYLYANI